MEPTVARFIICCAVVATTCQALTVKSCSQNPSADNVKVKWANVHPHPVQLPGEITVSASATVDQPISGDLTADVRISRSIGPMWLDIPCVNTPVGKLGSCTYDNICGILARTNVTGLCPRVMRWNNIKCECPQAGTYTIPQTTFNLDLKYLKLPVSVLKGHYKGSLTVVDKATMQEILCYDFDIELTDKPTKNRFGSIGRFFSNLFG